MTRRDTRGLFQKGTSLSLPGAWKPAYNAGSHISTAMTTAGSHLAMKTHPAVIAGLVRFLHRTESSSEAVRRGLASLRGTRRSNYLRRAVLKVLAMSKEERAAFDAPNGFFELAKLLIDAPSKGKEGAVIVQVWREIKETLGERVGSRWKDTLERNQEQPQIVVDIPSANYKADN